MPHIYPENCLSPTTITTPSNKPVSRPTHSPLQTAPGSTQPFCHNTPRSDRPTDRWSRRQTCKNTRLRSIDYIATRLKTNQVVVSATSPATATQPPNFISEPQQYSAHYNRAKILKLSKPGKTFPSGVPTGYPVPDRADYTAFCELSHNSSSLVYTLLVTVP